MLPCWSCAEGSGRDTGVSAWHVLTDEALLLSIVLVFKCIVAVELLLSGAMALRAGDIVAVELLPESQWRKPSAKLPVPPPAAGGGGGGGGC